MTPLTVPLLKTLTSGWAQARGGGFGLYFPVKGGWEGWCQVDLVAYMLARDSTYDVEREVLDVLRSGMRADLVANGTQPREQQLIVEMRAQSFYNRTTFVAGVRGDVEKLSQNRNQAWQTAPCAVIAIAFSQEAVQGVEEITSGQRIFSRIVQGQGNQYAVLMTAWERHHGWMPV